jgi:putative hemin transport protein
MTELAVDLAARWDALKSTTPMLRTRDAAAQLGVTEAELLATGLGSTVTRLDTDTPALLHGLVGVGRCMALTRNEHAVSEVHGTYGGIELGAHAGQVVGTGIDLRVFPTQWCHAFAVDEESPTKKPARRRSIHIFDRAGVAVHKIYLDDDGDVAAWDALVAARRSELPLVLEPAASKKPERADAEVDVAALGAAWDAMQDTHEFFHLLHAHRVSRTQALRLAGRERAYRVSNTSFTQLLHDASAQQDKIMIFVGNRGCLQVFSGSVKKIVKHGPWINVLDPGFNLHLREDHIASSYVVAKPTKAGMVRSLELFDADGETIALVFRKRDDREQAEDAGWIARLAGLPALELV